MVSCSFRLQWLYTDPTDAIQSDLVSALPAQWLQRMPHNDRDPGSILARDPILQVIPLSLFLFPVSLSATY